jgi:hypothetical protein
MSVLARKITRAKWDARGELADGEIPADAVTVDLRTTGNTLSFWSCDAGTDVGLKAALIALATGAEHIETIDIAWVTQQDLEQKELEVLPTEGETPVASLRARHVDVVRLDLVRHGIVARIVSLAVANHHVRWRRPEVRAALVDAVRGELVSLEDVKPTLRNEVTQALGKASE